MKNLPDLNNGLNNLFQDDLLDEMEQLQVYGGVSADGDNVTNTCTYNQCVVNENEKCCCSGNHTCGTGNNSCGTGCDCGKGNNSCGTGCNCGNGNSSCGTGNTTCGTGTNNSGAVSGNSGNTVNFLGYCKR